MVGSTKSEFHSLCGLGHASVCLPPRAGMAYRTLLLPFVGGRRSSLGLPGRVQGRCRGAGAMAREQDQGQRRRALTPKSSAHHLERGSAAQWEWPVRQGWTVVDCLVSLRHAQGGNRGCNRCDCHGQAPLQFVRLRVPYCCAESGGAARPGASRIGVGACCSSGVLRGGQRRVSSRLLVPKERGRKFPCLGR